jgi:hypothetical protein
VSIDVRVLCYNVREWNIPEMDLKFDIAEHIMGLDGVPIGSTIRVRDCERVPLSWGDKPVYEAIGTQYLRRGVVP